MSFSGHDMGTLLCHAVLLFLTTTGLLYVSFRCTLFSQNSKIQQILYDENMDITFVSGMPGSGITLMGELLDAHPEVGCSSDTRVIQQILTIYSQLNNNPVEKYFLTNAKVYGKVFDSAVTSFILEIIAKNGEAATRMYSTIPFALLSAKYLSNEFPNSRFIFMIRDGRAVVHSIITGKVTISGFDLKSYRKCLQKWNQAVESMYGQCLRVGPYRCMPVYYEQLVLHPELWMRRILGFLNIAWNDSVLHHEDYVGKPGGIFHSKTEKSTDQAIKPVNLEALSKWVGNIPGDVVRDMGNIAPMLQILGYDPEANPPNYGEPDSQIADNTLHLHRYRHFWNKS